MSTPTSPFTRCNVPEAAERCQLLMRVFGLDWASRPAELKLHPECETDLALMHSLYASTRAAELAYTDWSAAQQAAFVQQQFDAQRSQYRQHYPGAAFQVITLEGVGVGRIYLHLGEQGLRLMEITLLPGVRGRGIGRALLRQLMAWSEERDLPLSLHVEPFNPAHAWYQRLGFKVIERRGAYDFMQRDAQAREHA